MRQAARLELARIPQQRSGGAQGGAIPGLNAEPVERSEPVGADQVLPGELGVEFPGLALGDRDRVRSERGAAAGRHDDLGRLEARERDGKVGGEDALPDELAGGEIQRGDAGALAPRGAGDEEVVPFARQPVLGEHGARGDGLDHRPAHESLGELRVLHLLADRDAVALGDEAAQVLGRRLDGHPGERDLGGTAVVARGEGQAQLARGELGVVLEHFVEVAHPEEQNGLRIPSLDLAVLLHQRRVGRVGLRDPGRRRGRHGSSTMNGCPPTRVFSRCSVRCASSRVA